MEKYSKAVSEMHSQFKPREDHPTEKYSKAVSEMYSQFKPREDHPLEKYLAHFVSYCGVRMEVVGYSYIDLGNEPLLIVDASQADGWTELEPFDVVFKECESYWYARIDDLLD